MKKWAMIFCLVCVLLVVVGCNQEETTPDPDLEDEVIEVVEENMEATQNEDIDGVADTMHPESPIYENVLEETEMIFEQFDLEYEIEILDVTLNEEEANVEFEQKTVAVDDDPDFEDNIIRGIHVLQKYEGDWKIYHTEMIESEPVK